MVNHNLRRGKHTKANIRSRAGTMASDIIAKLKLMA